MNLSQINANSEFEVVEVKSEDLRERLTEMGVYKGLKGRLVKHLPFGGPVILQAGESLFAVRREDAQWIQIQEL
jgi:Fe2+ transport system protein FeoA